MSESVPRRAPRLGLLGLSRLRALKRKADRANEALEAGIMSELERRVYTAAEIAGAVGMSRQTVYNMVRRRER
jgi:hypothetical protein